MLKYLAKFASDILPSVAATIIGAYIVNHYITARPAAPATAAVSTPAADGKPADAPTNVANIPGDGVRAQGISEKAVFDKAAAEKPATEKPQEKAQEKPGEKAAEKATEKKEKAQEKSEDKPADTASISADIHRRPAPSHEKAAIRTIPLTAAPSVQPAASTAVPSNPPPVIEAKVNPEEHRDANDLAREAIERLRENSPRSQDAARAQDASRAVGPQQMAPAVQPLPPPVMVAAPAGDAFAPGVNGAQQPYPSSAQAYDPNRPIPPADIPSPQPLELGADNNGVPPLQQHNKNVAEDVLAAAKSVFHAVLPQ
jgi:hypothetical protein